jgi:DNA-binding NarL/FixJ family response regulator
MENKPEKDNPMKLLLIEDDAIESLAYSNLAQTRADVEFVGITNSCDTGIELLKSTLPEGIILDLQLIVGEGSGLQFMEMVRADESLTLFPLIVVTTSNQSKSVFKRLEELGVDWYFSKTASGYSHKLVIDTLLSLRPSLNAKQNLGEEKEAELYFSRNRVEAPFDRDKRLYLRIDAELNTVGIRAKLKGRAYLRDAIYSQIVHPSDRGSGLDYVMSKHNVVYSALVKSMQTAINDAWSNADPDALMDNFTARITARTGTPYMSDFVHYFAEKIKGSI